MASRVLELALLIASACSPGRDTSLVVVIDSNRPHEEREVIALPVNPASLHAPFGSAASISPRQSDSVARLVAMRDSAAMIDARYQSERDTLNLESRSLDRADRKSAEYARRFDAFRHRAFAAESLRATRDRLRARVAPLERQLSVDAALIAHDDSSLRSRIDTAVPTGRRRVVIARAQGDTAHLLLADGTWWIGVARQGKLPSRWKRVEVPFAGPVTLSQ